jgi:hypothetical protein
MTDDLIEAFLHPSTANRFAHRLAYPIIDDLMSVLVQVLERFANGSGTIADRHDVQRAVVIRIFALQRPPHRLSQRNQRLTLVINPFTEVLITAIMPFQHHHLVSTRLDDSAGHTCATPAARGLPFTL